VLHDLPEELAPALSDGRIAGGHCGVQADRVGEAGDNDDANQVPQQRVIKDDAVPLGMDAAAVLHAGGETGMKENPHYHS